MRNFILVACIGALSACSLVVPREQSLTIRAPSSDISVNGLDAGSNLVTVNVPRDRSVTVVARREGYQPDVAVVQSVPSITGKLDAAGVYFLLPAAGLFAPGAHSLETDFVVLAPKK